MRGAALLLVLAGAAIAHAAAEETGRPITKVIRVLKDMTETINKEQKEDEEVFDKLACWCQTNDRERTKTIAEEKQTIQVLQDAVENESGAEAGAGAKVDNLKEDIAEMKQSLETATAVRKKEKAAFVAQEKDLVQSISALKNAVQVLKKHNGGSFAEIRNMISFEAAKHSDILESNFGIHQHRQLNAFLQQPVGQQSGEIFGILTNMLETFEKDLEDSQNAEKAAQETFEELRGDKMEEMSDANDQLETTEGQFATAMQKGADAKQELIDTRESLAENEEFLASLKEQCKMTNNEWEQRQKTRGEELSAIANAIKILSGDNAQATFGRTTAFIQIENKESKLRTQAVSYLKNKARALQSASLFEAATAATGLDDFGVVILKIDDLVAELKAVQEEEVQHRDLCTKELNLNKKNTAAKNDEIEAANAYIAERASTIETLTTELANLNADNADMERNKKELTSTRKVENDDFMTTVADQRATQDLIQQAIDALNVFYAKQSGASFAQQAQTPPVQFKKYEKKGGNIVIDMLVKVKADAKAAETEAHNAEQAAQARYEEEMGRMNTLIKSNDATIADKTGLKGKAEQEKVNKEDQLKNNLSELEMLANEAEHIHGQCDYLWKNFDLRQEHRTAEMEALRNAKAILQGMGGTGFLQRF